MEKNLKKYRDKYIRITESFCCIPESLYINYNSILKVNDRKIAVIPQEKPLVNSFSHLRLLWFFGLAHREFAEQQTSTDE